jgi:hypothetical protein
MWANSGQPDSHAAFTQGEQLPVPLASSEESVMVNRKISLGVCAQNDVGGHFDDAEDGLVTLTCYLPRL